MRRNGSLFHVIYNNGYEAHDHNLIHISFVGSRQSFSVIAGGKCKGFDILRLKKENSRVTFAFNESKTNKYNVILCQSTEFNRSFAMSFKMMETFIKIFMEDGFMADMEG